MPKPVLHPKTQHALTAFLASPSQSLVLIGKNGAGKQTIVEFLAAQLLDTQNIANHPYYYQVGQKDTAISIDEIREVQHFLSRKTTSSSAINRVSVVLDAERLTPEAQNAFLKTLEEPPVGSILLLTVSDKEKLLPTIMSRVQSIDVTNPDTFLLRTHFQSQGYAQDNIDKALLMSGGLPGLMTAILEDEGSKHPLIAAANTARSLLRLDTFGRLTFVDSLSKQRQQCLDLCFILQQMAELSLGTASKNTTTYKQWQNILTEAYAAEQALLAQAQPKLVLTHLMLSL